MITFTESCRSLKHILFFSFFRRFLGLWTLYI